MSSDPYLPFAVPDIGEEEISEVVDSLRSGWITTGPKTIAFEKAFAEFVGCKHALAVNSATAGLHLALDAVGVGRGDKVITSPYTFTATAEVIRYFDADPIFSDVDPRTYNLDPQALDRTISQAIQQHGHHVKAIIPVHIAGQSCNMTQILDLARKYGLKVVEDAAHALPTTHKGNIIGSISDLTVFSFYATKTIATGEGGMVVTNSDTMAQRIKMMRLHGFNRDAWDRYNSPKAAWYYEILAPGFKYNLTDIASAIGLHQLSKARKFHAKRKAIAERYNQAFSSVHGLTIPFVERPDDEHAWHLYMLKVPKSTRDAFFETMRMSGIGCSVHFIPLHLHPFWRDRYNLSPADFPESTRAFEEELSLPIHTRMTENDITRVIETVLQVHKQLSPSVFIG